MYFEFTAKPNCVAYGSPVIPKFRLSYNSAHQHSKNIGPPLIKQVTNISGSERLPRNWSDANYS